MLCKEDVFTEQEKLENKKKRERERLVTLHFKEEWGHMPKNIDIL